MEAERPSASYIVDMLPPSARSASAADVIPAKLLHSSLNKIKHPVNIVRWTPEGRRLLTGSSSGEFTLWNGMGFNFETILQAHDSAIRAATYSHNEDWLVSSDQDGIVKYWQPNFNNVKAIQAHGDPIRDLAFSPNDSKFVTACDDATLKIFDFAGGIEESTLTGHGWDAKTVDWHPTKGLLVSGSKDHQVKLWDPRTGRCLTTLHGHKNPIARTKFEPERGQLLATCARDAVARVFDLRMMRDICLLKGHDKDITAVTWHPIHVNLLTTGGADGSIFHYLLDEPNTPTGIASTIPPYDSLDPSIAPAQAIYPAHKVQYAHEYSVWSFDWHPLGHILASGSNDRVTRFWTRPRPGETQCFNDRHHLGEEGAAAAGTWSKRDRQKFRREDEMMEDEDEAEGLEDQQMPAKRPEFPAIPGLTSPTPNGVPAGLAQPQFAGISNFPVPPPPPNFRNGGAFPPNDIANMDPEKFRAMMASGTLPPPPPVNQFGRQGVPPPPPNFDFSRFPQGLLPPNFQSPQDGGLSRPDPDGPSGGFEGLPGIGPDTGVGGGGGSKRSRVPLPSQQERLMMEQQQGKYRIAR